jgi:hypothetical protein
VTFEALNTAAALGTFLVISATAIAALVQLRHIRRANQLSGLMKTFDLLQDPGVRDLVNFVRHDLAVRMADREFRDGLATVPVDRTVHPELYLCDIYQHIGSFVRSGLIDEDIYLQTEWYNVTLYWRLLSETVKNGRRGGSPYLFENFEYLAQRAESWRIKHPGGDYPARTPRLLER